MKRVILSMLAVSALVFTSCSDDNDTPSNNVTAPSTYVFERNGESTVSFSGQTTRIKMGQEIISALKDRTKTSEQILGMFNNTGNNFSDAALNAATSKIVAKKTAASFDYFASSADLQVKADFVAYINDQVNNVFPQDVWNRTATKGNAGKIEEAGGSVRYVNGKGLELNQAFNKGLIGAMMVDQIINNYISSRVLDPFQDANDAGTLVDGKTYTDMEHDWDEAYGYLFGNVTAANRATPLKELGDADSFLNKYLGKVNKDADFAGIGQKVYDALKLGRAAIVAKNYIVRNQQAEIIREKISEVVGVRAVYYLQSAKTVLEGTGTIDYASAFHDLSEAYGFIYSLQFTRKPNVSTPTPYLTRAEVLSVLGNIYTNKTNGFWDVTPAELQTASETIANKFNFTVAQAGS